MTEIIDSVQLQEVGDALVELFEVTLPSGSIAYFYNGLEGGTDNIYFSNTSGTVLNEYVAFPIKIEGIEVKSAGAQNRPSLTVANIAAMARVYANDSDGFNDETLISDILSGEGIETNEDLIYSRVVYRSTLLKYTQRVGDSPEIPTEFPSATYIIDRVSQESSILVQFELTSPIDVEGLKIPNRVVIGKYCPWKYQGHALDNDGGCYWPLDSNGLFFDQNDNVITKNIAGFSEWNTTSTYFSGTAIKTIRNGHTKIWQALRNVPANKDPETNPVYWTRLDACGKLINSCKIRFQGNLANSSLDTSNPLPFGGFPGSKKFK